MASYIISLKARTILKARFSSIQEILNVMAGILTLIVRLSDAHVNLKEWLFSILHQMICSHHGKGLLVATTKLKLLFEEELLASA